MAAKRITIVSPATSAHNNGNWQTASRWAAMLGTRHQVDIVQQWSDADGAPDLLIALHARRAAAPLAAFCSAYPSRPAALVLTGTDLYRDIAVDASAQASLAYATQLVLLQPAGLALLPAPMRARARVIFQSAPTLTRPPPMTGVASAPQIIMIGHLRAEKDPATFMAAAALVKAPGVRLLHLGGALDAALGQQAAATARANPRYRWRGNLPHAQARELLRHSAAMVIASTMEGGANVIIEAVTCGVPVIASDISGNRGMLGDDYGAYFAAGDAVALAALIDRCLTDAPFYARLLAQCAVRAALFTPAAEQAALLQLVDNLCDPAQAPLQPQEAP
ncbi:selenoneine biosynthesis selenosugar synthase SenB [Massilia sp. PWRC2]|uniref:selenoneine biosynthesis selenosugar synthase SenB n=1 Tax=Massilia sp. PWRC2 TaxID=2804626 RepID=UPI003CED8EEB